jgi:hypothetical protein
MTRATWAYSRTQPSTLLVMEPSSTSQLPNLLHIPSSQPEHVPQRKELRATNPAACKAWATYRLVLSITCNQFAAAINNVYYAILDDPSEGLNGIDLRTLVTHILTTYAQISQPNLDDNLTDFNTGINPILPLAVYTRKQEKCQIFAHNAGVPISDATMVTTGTKHALATGNMTLVWREWKQHSIVDHTWPNWKAHWTAAFAKMHNIHCMTAGESTFGTNTAEEEEQGRLIASSLDNLASASIQKQFNDWQPRCDKCTTDAGVGGHADCNGWHESSRACPTALRYNPDMGAQSPAHRGPTGSTWPSPSECPYSAPFPLGRYQTELGQGGILLDARLQGEGRAQQYHVLIPFHWPSNGCNTGQHHGWELVQRRLSRSPMRATPPTTHLVVRSSGRVYC